MSSAPMQLRMDFVSALALLKKWRYTGVLMLHCAEGVPKVLEVPGPAARLEIDASGPITEITIKSGT